MKRIIVRNLLTVLGFVNTIIDIKENDKFETVQ